MNYALWEWLNRYSLVRPFIFREIYHQAEDREFIVAVRCFVDSSLDDRYLRIQG